MIVVEGKKSLRRFKIRIDGRDKTGKTTSRMITLIADNIDEVYEAVLKGLEAAKGAPERGDK